MSHLVSKYQENAKTRAANEKIKIEKHSFGGGHKALWQSDRRFYHGMTIKQLDAMRQKMAQSSWGGLQSGRSVFDDDEEFCVAYFEKYFADELSSEFQEH